MRNRMCGCENGVTTILEGVASKKGNWIFKRGWGIDFENLDLICVDTDMG